MAEEFEEIAHSGGTFSFTCHPGQGTSIGWSQASSWPLVLMDLCVSLDGEIISFGRFAGLGSKSVNPEPTVKCALVSDREGFFGASCPACRRYFRVTPMGSSMTCPYCGISNTGIAFLTENQLKFVKAFYEAFFKAHENEETVVIKVEDLVGGLEANKQGWIYTEERLQSQHKCLKCNEYGSHKYDILGEYGVCPLCGHPNFGEVIKENLNSLEGRYAADEGSKVIDNEDLSRVFSDLEALGNAVRKHILQYPSTPLRKKEINGLSFQRLDEAARNLKQWCGIDMYRGISEGQLEFLNLMINRRHVFMHNGGEITQKYLDQTGDTTVRLGQVIRLTSGEVKRLIPIIRQCANNLSEDFVNSKTKQTYSKISIYE